MSNQENQQLIDNIDSLHKQKKYNEAIKLCKEVINVNQTNYLVHKKLGDLYLEKHCNIYYAGFPIEEAITEYQAALEYAVDDPEINYKIGIALELKGELNKALEKYKFAIKNEKTVVDAYYKMGQIFLKKDLIYDAIQYFTNIINLNKLTSSRAYFGLAQAYKKEYKSLKSKILKQKLTIRLKIFRNVICGLFTLPFDIKFVTKLFQKTVRIYKYAPLFLKCYFLEHLGAPEKAIDIYTKTLEKTPGLVPLYLALGDLYKSINHLEDAMNEYRMAIWIDPTNVQAHKKLCNTLEEMGDYDTAIKNYQKIIEIRPNEGVLHSNLANLLYIKGDYTSAISSYQTAIILNPNKTWTSVVAQTLGYVLQESKEDYDAAINAYQTAILLNPYDIDLYISLGSAFFDKGDLNNALATYRAALSIDPHNAKVHCNLGYLLWGKNALDDAILEYKKAISLDPGYDIAYNNLGVIYLDDLANLTVACELFERAIQINPNYALAHYNLGRAMTIKDDKVEAARLFQVAIDLNVYTNELDPNEVKDRIARLFDSE